MLKSVAKTERVCYNKENREKYLRRTTNISLRFNFLMLDRGRSKQEEEFMTHSLPHRMLTLFLAITMIVVMCGFISCDKNPLPPDTDDPIKEKPGDTDNPDDGQSIDYTDDLPEGLNYGGYVFRICTRERNFFHSNWITDDYDGTKINDAIYVRQCDVGERLGVTFTEELVQSTEPARVAIMAGSDDYDMLNARGSEAWAYAEEGLCIPVEELTYVDISKPYWDDMLNEAMTVGNVMYFTTGMSNITAYDFTHALLFNKDMVENYSLSDPFQLVRNDQWTIEEFATMAEAVTTLVDGNEEESVYGYISQPKHVLPGFWIAAGIVSIEKNSEDIPEFTLPTNDSFVELFDYVYEITYDYEIWYRNESRENEDPTLLNMFQSDRGLFYATSFFYIEGLRGMKADFGILPYPKYSESQENYYSRVEGCELSCIPNTTANKDRTSAVMEAMASKSATTVKTAYYDISLKNQTARDDESSAMLDIIFNSRVYDLGDTIWCDTLRDGVFETMFMKGDRSLASKLESVKGVLESKIEYSVTKFLED